MGSIAATGRTAGAAALVATAGALLLAAPAAAQSDPSADPIAAVGEVVAGLDAIAAPPPPPPVDAMPQVVEEAAVQPVLEVPTPPVPEVPPPAPDAAPVQDEPDPAPAPAATPAPQSAPSGATQSQPVNVNVSVRVLSPGDDGAVTQSNVAAAPSGSGEPRQAARPAGAGGPTVIFNWVWNWTQITQSAPALPDALRDEIADLPSIPDMPVPAGMPAMPSIDLPPEISEAIPRKLRALAAPDRSPPRAAPRRRRPVDPGIPPPQPPGVLAPSLLQTAIATTALPPPPAPADADRRKQRRAQSQPAPADGTGGAPRPQAVAAIAGAAGSSSSVAFGLAVLTAVLLLSLPWLNTKLVTVGAHGGRSIGPPRDRPG